jgi:hypothetical protein
MLVRACKKWWNRFFAQKILEKNHVFLEIANIIKK